VLLDIEDTYYCPFPSKRLLEFVLEKKREIDPDTVIGSLAGCCQRSKKKLDCPESLSFYKVDEKKKQIRSIEPDIE
jgi:hypothetical protein